MTVDPRLALLANQIERVERRLAQIQLERWELETVLAELMKEQAAARRRLADPHRTGGHVDA